MSAHSRPSAFSHWEGTFGVASVVGGVVAVHPATGMCRVGSFAFSAGWGDSGVVVAGSSVHSSIVSTVVVHVLFCWVPFSRVVSSRGVGSVSIVSVSRSAMFRVSFIMSATVSFSGSVVRSSR